MGCFSCAMRRSESYWVSKHHLQSFSSQNLNSGSLSPSPSLSLYLSLSFSPSLSPCLSRSLLRAQECRPRLRNRNGVTEWGHCLPFIQYSCDGGGRAWSMALQLRATAALEGLRAAAITNQVKGTRPDVTQSLKEIKKTQCYFTPTRPAPQVIATLH